MNARAPILRLPVLAGLAAGILVVGLAVDLGYTQRQRGALGRWSEQRSKLRADWSSRTLAEEDARRMASRLGAAGLDGALAGLRRVEPISLLADHLAAAGLLREELGVEGTNPAGTLRRTRIYLRARGGYGQIFRFLQACERGPSLMTIDELRIRSGEGPDLDLRVRLSFYQPAGG